MTLTCHPSTCSFNTEYKSNKQSLKRKGLYPFKHIQYYDMFQKNPLRPQNLNLALILAVGPLSEYNSLFHGGNNHKTLPTAGMEQIPLPIQSLVWFW